MAQTTAKVGAKHDDIVASPVNVVKSMANSSQMKQRLAKLNFHVQKKNLMSSNAFQERRATSNLSMDRTSTLKKSPDKKTAD